MSVKLRSFLKEGDIIRTKHCNTTNWVTNIVYAINEDYIEIDIGLEQNYIENIIMIGDTMKCKYTSEENEYTLIGWVSRIKMENPRSITIKVHDIVQFNNNREGYRYDVYLCSVIKTESESSNGVFAVMINMSSTGAAFVVKDDIDKQNEIKDDMKEKLIYKFEIFISPTEKVNFEGVIKRKGGNEKGIEYGVKIINMSDDSKKIYEEFLDTLEKKDKEFYNKRSSFWSQHSKYNK